MYSSNQGFFCTDQRLHIARDPSRNPPRMRPPLIQQAQTPGLSSASRFTTPRGLFSNFGPRVPVVASHNCTVPAPLPSGGKQTVLLSGEKQMFRIQEKTVPDENPLKIRVCFRSPVCVSHNFNVRSPHKLIDVLKTNSVSGEKYRLRTLSTTVHLKCPRNVSCTSPDTADQRSIVALNEAANIVSPSGEKTAHRLFRRSGSPANTPSNRPEVTA